MNLISQKFVFLCFALLGISYLANFEEIHRKNTSNNDIAENYIKIWDQYLPVSKSNALLQLQFQSVDWSVLGPMMFAKRVGQDIVKSEVANIEIFAESKTAHAIFSTSTVDKIFWNAVRKKMGTDLSLYVKVKDQDGTSYLSSWNTGSEPYFSALLSSDFLGASKISLQNKSSNIELLTDSASLIVPITGLNNAIHPIYLSNETALEKINNSLQIDNKHQDTLHVMIKTANGNIHKLAFPSGTDIQLNDLMKSHADESTIYFCLGDPHDTNRKLGVMVISNRQTILAIQPTFLENSIGFYFNNLSFKNLEYEAADINFVWGDIQLKLTKNTDGDYFAKKRIGKSKWNNTHLKRPNLRLGKSLYIDSLTFDLSIATQNLDTTNKVVVENVGSEPNILPFNINLADTLSTIPNKNQKSVIRIEGIQNENITKSNISLEIEIFDDTPKRKQKKYQFHWGAIDTTLMQKSKSKQFKESVSLPINKFLKMLAKEPVLTSSEEGVVKEFSYKILHFRKLDLLTSKIMHSNVKDAAVFMNSIKGMRLHDHVKVGDKISLRSFTGPEMTSNDDIRLDILIDKISQEENELSIDDNNIFLEWGTRKLKTTTLGDKSRKKSVQDQIIEKISLIDVIDKQMILNKYGKKESIVHAEWFINDNKYDKKTCSDDKDWKKCFASDLRSVRSGDFISMFMRTSKGYGAICQFHIDYVATDAILGFGNTEFDSLLFKYSKHHYTKPAKPKYNYELIWGEVGVDLELRGNPRVYGGETSIKLDKLKEIFENKIQLNSSDGEVISVEHAYLVIHKIRSPEVEWKYQAYDFDCKDLDCAMKIEDALKVLEELQGKVHSVSVFIDKHNPTEENIKISFINFIIEDDNRAWRPKYWVQKNKDNELFEFQFVYQNKGKTLIKLDKQNEKYQWIVEKYLKDATVELIDLPGFKTPNRAIYTKNDWGNHQSIRTTQVLSKNYINGYALYDYHDATAQKVSLYWKGYAALYGSQSYCKEDFVCADGGLDLEIGNEEVNILRGDLIILPENGPGFKFVFDNINTEEINAALQELPEKSSLFFENLIVESKDGTPKRLPLKFAYHIE